MNSPAAIVVWARLVDLGTGFSSADPGLDRGPFWTRRQIDTGHRDARNRCRSALGDLGRLVGEVGLEPTISCSQSTCVANYATSRRSRACEWHMTLRVPGIGKRAALDRNPRGSATTAQ